MRWKAVVLILIQFIVIGCAITQPKPPLSPISPLMSPRGMESPLALVKLAYLPVAQRVGVHSYDPAAQEAAFVKLLVNAPGQQRPVMRYNEILGRCARSKAQEMASRNYFGHTSPDGETPNQLARRCGYRFPPIYPTIGNSIESLAAGRENAEQTFYDLLSSPSHKMHLMGEHEFYRQQTEYGIGYAYNPSSYYQWYWVIWIAEPGE